MKQSLSEKLPAAVVEFVFYSFVGWTYETIFTAAYNGVYMDRGWLHLPLCPIYGFCGLALLLIFGRVKNIPLIFVLGAALTTAAELAASYLLELFTGERLWDYSHWRFNFDGRIALLTSLIFGALCVLLVKCLHPLAEKITKKMSAKALNITAAIMSAAILTDTVICILGR